MAKRRKKSKLKLHEIIDFPDSVNVPFYASCVFPDNFGVFKGAEKTVGFGGDYVSMKELRKSLEWLADQLNGKITWKNETK